LETGSRGIVRDRERCRHACSRHAYPSLIQRIANLLEHGDAESLPDALRDASEMASIWRRFGNDPKRANN
jgi:hypothetical protein